MTAWQVFLLALPLLPSVWGQAGRVPCGVGSPNQDICDSVSDSGRRGALRLPIRAECAQEPLSQLYYCGFAGAACSSDSQCDFGYCELDSLASGTRAPRGRCVGGLGQSCEGPDGPDDSLCAGNLACGSRVSDRTAVCGGKGAECFYNANFEIRDEPNHLACQSGYCNPSTLTCSTQEPPMWHDAKRTAIIFANARAGSVEAESERRTKETRPSGNSLQLAVDSALKCDIGLTNCPFVDPSGELAYACFNIRTSRTQCGGCSLRSLSAIYNGEDCTDMPGAASAICQQGKCRALSCSSGYSLDVRKRTCVASYDFYEP